MKIAICLQCDTKMKGLQNLLWCQSCDLVADARILEETRKAQAWERSDFFGSVHWVRLKPYERKIPKPKVYGFASSY